MTYQDQEKKKATRSRYNKAEYAATKADPVMYELYLERQREKKRRRTIKKQDQKIEEAYRRLLQCRNYNECYNVPWQVLKHFATAVLYPERLNK